MLLSLCVLGFFVVRTKDVMESAKEAKEAKEIKEKGKGHERCLEELALVDVPIGRVHILATSFDSSFLVASVGPQVHFFNVDSLMNKVFPSASISSLSTYLIPC